MDRHDGASPPKIRRQEHENKSDKQRSAKASYRAKDSQGSCRGRGNNSVVDTRQVDRKWKSHIEYTSRKRNDQNESQHRQKSNTQDKSRKKPVDKNGESRKKKAVDSNKKSSAKESKIEKNLLIDFPRGGKVKSVVKDVKQDSFVEFGKAFGKLQDAHNTEMSRNANDRNETSSKKKSTKAKKPKPQNKKKKKKKKGRHIA